MTSPFSITNVKIINIEGPGPHKLEDLIKTYPEAFLKVTTSHYRLEKGWSIYGEWFLGSKDICLEIPNDDGPSTWYQCVKIFSSDDYGEGLLYFIGEKWTPEESARSFKPFRPEFMYRSNSPYATFLAVDPFVPREYFICAATMWELELKYHAPEHNLMTDWHPIYLFPNLIGKGKRNK